MNLATSGRYVRLDRRDPAFFNDPYPAYAAICAVAPIFFWKDYGFWCFATHADVSAPLRLDAPLHLFTLNALEDVEFAS